MKIIIIIMSLLSLWACTKEEKNTRVLKLEGKWELVEYTVNWQEGENFYTEWVTVTEDYPYSFYIEFKDNLTFNSDRFYEPCTQGTFSFDNEKIYYEYIYECENAGVITASSYYFEDDYLIIKPVDGQVCVDDLCLSKLKKVKY